MVSKTTCRVARAVNSCLELAGCCVLGIFPVPLWPSACTFLHKSDQHLFFLRSRPEDFRLHSSGYSVVHHQRYETGRLTTPTSIILGKSSTKNLREVYLSWRTTRSTAPDSSIGENRHPILFNYRPLRYCVVSRQATLPRRRPMTYTLRAQTSRTSKVPSGKFPCVGTWAQAKSGISRGTFCRERGDQ